MSQPLPEWIDCWYPVKEGDLISIRLREPPIEGKPPWRVCWDNEPGEGRIAMRVVKVVRQPGGYLAAKVERQNS